jgi:lipopolysaccharide/colanic/teichoic acid biosynthesis glycosyltransferase
VPNRGDLFPDSAAPVDLAVPQDLPVSSDCGFVNPRSLYLLVGKRSIDISLSLLGLILFAPAFIIISGLIKLGSPGPVVFRQRRVGKNGRLFWILKFRSMVDGTDRIGGGITLENDPRVTSFGTFLRRWKLDELPQLWNVLRGEMSLVGPRPELPSYVAEYSYEQKNVLKAKPGITDPASLCYRDESHSLQQCPDPERWYREKILPHKLSLSLQYTQNISFAHDLSLLLSTIKAVMKSAETKKRG